MDWFKLCRAIDIVVDVVWPTTIASTVLTFAACLAGAHVWEAWTK